MTGEPQRDVPHLAHIRAADAILHRPAHGRAEPQRRDPADHAREILRERRLEPRLQPLARCHVLGDDDRLGEEVVRQLDVERQIEADRAAADIGAPVLDVGIALKSLSSRAADVSLA